MRMPSWGAGEADEVDEESEDGRSLMKTGLGVAPNMVAKSAALSGADWDEDVDEARLLDMSGISK